MTDLTPLRRKELRDIANAINAGFVDPSTYALELAEFVLDTVETPVLPLSDQLRTLDIDEMGEDTLEYLVTRAEYLETNLADARAELSSRQSVTNATNSKKHLKNLITTNLELVKDQEEVSSKVCSILERDYMHIPETGGAADYVEGIYTGFGNSKGHIVADILLEEGYEFDIDKHGDYMRDITAACDEISQVLSEWLDYMTEWELLVSEGK